jgi:hypothetical protein
MCAPDPRGVPTVTAHVRETFNKRARVPADQFHSEIRSKDDVTQGAEGGNLNWQREAQGQELWLSVRP